MSLDQLKILPADVTGPSLGLRRFFRSNLNRWADFYKRQTIHARIYQERQATAVQYARTLNLPGGSFVLDAGCGPGLTSIALAQNGCVVHAVDFLQEMAATTAELGRGAGVGDRVRPTVGDVIHLPFANEVFDLVVMLGVTEWVPPLESLVKEATRVIKPGGHLIIAWNNTWGLHLILDPAANPVLRPLRRRLRGFLEDRGWIAPPPREYRYTLSNLQRAFRKHGMSTLRVRGIGFGPFSILGYNLVPENLGHQLNSGLQRLADTRIPLLHSVARNHVAIARKIR